MGGQESFFVHVVSVGIHYHSHHPFKHKPDIYNGPEFGHICACRCLKKCLMVSSHQQVQYWQQSDNFFPYSFFSLNMNLLIRHHLKGINNSTCSIACDNGVRLGGRQCGFQPHTPQILAWKLPYFVISSSIFGFTFHKGHFHLRKGNTESPIRQQDFPRCC